MLSYADVFIVMNRDANNIGNWSVQDLARIGDVPVQNCFVERSFSSYKDVLSDRRHNLLEKNLKKLLFCMCNSN